MCKKWCAERSISEGTYWIITGAWRGGEGEAQSLPMCDTCGYQGESYHSVLNDPEAIMVDARLLDVVSIVRAGEGGTRLFSPGGRQRCTGEDA